MELMVMTSPDKFRSEIYIVIKLFENGLETLHLKKPKFSKRHYKSYINQIPKKYHKNIIVHNYYSLIFNYNLKGFSFSTKNKPSLLIKTLTKFFKSKLIYTTTCNSISQLKNLRLNNYNYIQTGPLYKSKNDIKIINSNFNENNIKEITFSFPKKIVFFGGITIENLNLLNNNHLQGIVILGSIWYNKNQQPLDVFLDFKKRINNSKTYES